MTRWQRQLAEIRQSTANSVREKVKWGTATCKMREGDEMELSPAAEAFGIQSIFKMWDRRSKQARLVWVKDGEIVDPRDMKKLKQDFADFEAELRVEQRQQRERHDNLRNTVEDLSNTVSNLGNTVENLGNRVDTVEGAVSAGHEMLNEQDARIGENKRLAEQAISGLTDRVNVVEASGRAHAAQQEETLQGVSNRLDGHDARHDGHDMLIRDLATGLNDETARIDRMVERLTARMVRGFDKRREETNNLMSLVSPAQPARRLAHARPLDPPCSPPAASRRRRPTRRSRPAH